MAKTAPAPEVLSLEIVQVPIDDLQPHPENPNQGDVGVISESITHNGYYAPVIVQRSTNTIIAGEHRWHAARALGMATIPAIYVDVTDEGAKRILLADNRTVRVGYDDVDQLASVLKSLVGTEDSLIGTGYDSDELDSLLATLQTDDPDEPVIFDESGEPIVSATTEDDETDKAAPKFRIILEYTSREERDQALDKLVSEGYPAAARNR